MNVFISGNQFVNQKRYAPYFNVLSVRISLLIRSYSLYSLWKISIYSALSNVIFTQGS